MLKLHKSTDVPHNTNRKKHNKANDKFVLTFLLELNQNKGQS